MHPTSGGFRQTMKKQANRFAALSLHSGYPLENNSEEEFSGKEKLKTSIEAENDVSELAKRANGKASSTNLRWPLVWIDLEMTGLNVEEDRILEIACIITDGHLSKSVEGPDLIINQSNECLTRMNEWCQDHHLGSGLVEEVKKSTVTEEEAEQQVLEFVKHHTGPISPSLAGNSIYVDFMFLKKYMPKLAAVFSHVLVDVSSIKALCYRWYPKEAEKAPKKKNSHRALTDIKDSIAELKYLRKAIFKEPRR
eukprot:TRINITY_DN5503_c0_g1_i1.p1 TRINITY_DN5503_c0_g1~~TRINITY_DN5503_c0_g1_i1.p1  ORF type:complete len:252 (+),score=63.68 TRINITY_DN5503_c0_g1_i1:246-1001(+)